MSETEMTLEQAHTQGFTLVQAHTNRLVAYVRELPADIINRHVPGLTWTVGEVIAHMQSVYERYTIDRRRAPSPAGVAEQNIADIARLGVNVAAAVKSIEAQVAGMASRVVVVKPAQLFPFHAGQQATVAGGWGNLLGELLAHGDDLARATGQHFGMPGQDLEITWRFTLPVLQGWLRSETRELDESWDLRFPFGEIRLAFSGGALAVGPEQARRPHHFALDIKDVEAFTLAFPYRRRAITEPVAALLATRFYDL